MFLLCQKNFQLILLQLWPLRVNQVMKSNMKEVRNYPHKTIYH